MVFDSYFIKSFGYEIAYLLIPYLGAFVFAKFLDMERSPSQLKKLHERNFSITERLLPSLVIFQVTLLFLFGHHYAAVFYESEMFPERLDRVQARILEAGKFIDPDYDYRVFEFEWNGKVYRGTSYQRPTGVPERSDKVYEAEFYKGKPAYSRLKEHSSVEPLGEKLFPIFILYFLVIPLLMAFNVMQGRAGILDPKCWKQPMALVATGVSLVLFVITLVKPSISLWLVSEVSYLLFFPLYLFLQFV